MDLFRKRQKLIFWIVTIIIVPSFVLVWGVGSLFERSDEQGNFTVGTVNGKPLDFTEFDAFRRRLQAAVGGVPLQFHNSPGQGTSTEELWKYILSYTVLQDAIAAGIRSSDIEVGTYLENGHPQIAPRYTRGDRQSLERAVDDFCRQMQLTRQEFLRGIREWHTIGTYLSDDSNLAAVGDEMVYKFYAVNRAETGIKRVRIAESAAITEQATQEVMEKSTEELEQAARDYAASHASERRYRDPSAWRFAYLLLPFVPESSVRQPTEEEIQEFYDNNRALRFDDQPLSDVEDQIREELVRQEVERQTLRNMTVDVDEQLRNQGGLPLEELVKLTQIAKYSAVAGETSPEPLEVAEVIQALPAGADMEIRFILETLDSEGDEGRNLFLEEWRQGFNMTLRPFRSEDGYYRLRLLEYRPSTPSAIDGEDGSIRPEIYEIALADLIGERADELVGERAAELESRLRRLTDAREAGEEITDSEVDELLAGIETEYLTTQQVIQNNYELSSLAVGDLIGPFPYIDSESGQSGQELVVLAERRVPSREDYETESDQIKAFFRQRAIGAFRGSYGFTYTANGPEALIQPGPTIMGSLVERLNRMEIGLNPELLRSVEI